jgi:hypothetical protein
LVTKTNTKMITNFLVNLLEVRKALITKESLLSIIDNKIREHLITKGKIIILCSLVRKINKIQV